jgi:hypothetical protein
MPATDIEMNKKVRAVRRWIRTRMEVEQDALMRYQPPGVATGPCMALVVRHLQRLRYDRFKEVLRLFDICSEDFMKLMDLIISIETLYDKKPMSYFEESFVKEG